MENARFTPQNGHAVTVIQQSMKTLPATFAAAVHSTLESTAVLALLAKGRAIVLERIACGGGETRWYFCRDKQSFDQIEAAFTPGSVVSFYFDERIHPLSASSTADSETEQIIAHDRELVVGVLENDIHIRVDFPCSQAGLQEFRSSVAPTPCCSLGHFPPGKTTASAP
jgi:hypothetical protein